MGGSESKQWDSSTRIDWTQKGAADLRAEIEKKVQAQIQRLNILVFGPTGCGKSSLCNGLKTSLDGTKDVSGYYAIGAGADRSFTKKFQFDEWWGGVRLYDMAGVFESPDIKSENIMNIIEGKVPFTGEMDDFLNPKSLASQSTRTNVSCVVLVLKPGMELPENLRRIVEQIHRSAGEGTSLHHLVLTHLDKVDDCFEDPNTLDQVLTSERVHAATMQMSKVVGTPPNAISFVRNYAVEKESDIKSTVLFLHTFKQIVNAACDQERKRALMNQ